MLDAGRSEREQQEKALSALVRSVKVSLNLTREKAKRIVSLDFENYHLWADRGDPKEAQGLAETAFEDDLSQAEEALAWRAVVVAYRVGEALLRYVWAHDRLGDSWMDWRRAPPDEPAGEFVHSLDGDEFLCARVARDVHAVVSLPNRPSAVPSDGDLEGVPGYLEVKDSYTWPQWFEILGEPPHEIRCSALLDLANSAARRDLGEGEYSSLSSEILRRLSELVDLVESTTALQIPTIDYLERIGAQVDTLGAPSRFKAEEALRQALGLEVWSYLCSDAQTAAIEAERRYRDPGTVDWNSVVAGWAKAFELQVKQGFLPLLCDYLRQRGVQSFPDDERLPTGGMRPILIRNGRVASRMNLSRVRIALGSQRRELREFCEVQGFDLPALQRLIERVEVDRNPAAHEAGMTYAVASELREKWLGVTSGDGGIFGALLPKGRPQDAGMANPSL